MDEDASFLPRQGRPNTALQTTRENVAKIIDYNHLFRLGVGGAMVIARV